MPTKLTLTYVALDILFLLLGALILAFVLISESNMRATPTSDTVAAHLLLSQCPLTPGIVNAICMFVTFIMSLPALFLPNNKGWLRAHGWGVTSCAIFTLGLGAAIWFETLQTRSNLGGIWASESQQTQGLLQQKFQCCGYNNPFNPHYITDNTCPTDLVASQLGGCIGPFSTYANVYLDVIFTALFGIVGLDTVLLLCVACVLKTRKEAERYRHIDEKLGGLRA